MRNKYEVTNNFYYPDRSRDTSIKRRAMHLKGKDVDFDNKE